MSKLVDAIYSNNLDLAIELIYSGYDINFRGSGGYTPLMWAADHGYIGLVKLLIKLGADVNATNEMGNRAIDWAAYWLHKNICLVLIENGSEIDTLFENTITAELNQYYNDIFNLKLISYYKHKKNTYR